MVLEVKRKKYKSAVATAKRHALATAAKYEGCLNLINRSQKKK